MVLEILCLLILMSVIICFLGGKDIIFLLWGAAILITVLYLMVYGVHIIFTSLGLQW